MTDAVLRGPGGRRGNSQRPGSLWQVINTAVTYLGRVYILMIP